MIVAAERMRVELMSSLKEYSKEDKDHRYYYHVDSYLTLMLEHSMELDYSFVDDTLETRDKTHPSISFEIDRLLWSDVEVGTPIWFCCIMLLP